MNLITTGFAICDHSSMVDAFKHTIVSNQVILFVFWQKLKGDQYKGHSIMIKIQMFMLTQGLEQLKHR